MPTVAQVWPLLALVFAAMGGFVVWIAYMSRRFDRRWGDD